MDEQTDQGEGLKMAASSHLALDTSHTLDKSLQPNHAHTRTYQACIPCRNRKVRCDLGPVDDPQNPPCQRCRRESKDCFFSDTRRKRKGGDEEGESEDIDPDPYEVRNGRKRVRSHSSEAPSSRNGHSTGPFSAHASPPNSISRLHTPGGTVGRHEPFVRPKHSIQPVDRSSEEDDQRLNNDTTAILQHTEVFSGLDALNMLSEAAGRARDNKTHRSGSSGNLSRPRTPTHDHKSNALHAKRSIGRLDRSSSRAKPALRLSSGAMSTVDKIVIPEGYHDAIQAWSKFRFVRAGWFTAQESIDYIGYFYKYLSPMTPITIPDLHSPLVHAKLLSDEPMLAVTLLTISSRYMVLTGPGATSRAFAIHEKLWTFLQGMINRMIYGQEQFGGSFCGAGLKPIINQKAAGIRGLRTLGAIESLLLVTEWHSRALHFPPGDESDELIVSDCPSERTDGLSAAAEENPVPSVGGKNIDSWLEPVWRSDRMSWSLLANAMALAYELGIFDQVNNKSTETTIATNTTSGIQRRRNNIRRLLFVYISQTSGRLSLPSMLSDVHGDFLFVEHPLDAAGRLTSAQHGRGQLDELSKRPEVLQDVVLYFWCGLAQVMKEGNSNLFSSRELTRNIIATGQYVDLLQDFGTKIQQWRDEFEKCTIVPTRMRHILNIEYEYARVYVFAVALQAVVQRCTGGTPTSKSSNGIIPGHRLMKWLDGDRKFITIIISASRSLLRSVVTGLLPDGYLKHASVRTYFRIISVSIILLKTFALGATEDDVSLSLNLMDKAAEGLRTCIVDDVHVGSRFAELLETMTRRVRSRIVRIAANGSRAASRATTPSPTKESAHRREHPHQAAIGLVPMVSSNNPPTQRNYLSAPPLRQQHQWASMNQQYTDQPNQLHTTNSCADGLTYPPQIQGQIYNDPSLCGSLYDPYKPSVSIMPPPCYTFIKGVGNYDPHGFANGNSNSNSNSNGQLGDQQLYNDTGPSVASSDTYADNPCTPGWSSGMDWLALPLDPLLNSSFGSDVTHAGYGPDVGGYDMLDLLLQDWNTNDGVMGDIGGI